MTETKTNLSPEEKLLQAIFGGGMDPHPARSEVNGITLRKAIDSVLSEFTEREVKVLHTRFGFDDPLGKAQTYEAMGKIFGVTRERTRQITERTLRRLRHPSRSRRLKLYLGLDPLDD